jgi:hypothetical protein
VPLLTSKEIAEDLQIPIQTLYTIANQVPGLAPCGKYLKKGNRTEAVPSVYTAYQHQKLGRMLEFAPGDSMDEKVQAILDGYRLSLEEKEMLYQSAATQEQVTTLASRLNEMWETFKRTVGNPRPKRPAALTPELEGLTPDEARYRAEELRLMDPEWAYMLSKKEHDRKAIEHYLGTLHAVPGTKIHGDEIIDTIAKFDPYLGELLRPKSHEWRRFRSLLIGTGRLKAPEKGGTGYLIVAEKEPECTP